jgi:hypothetical protein
LPGSPREGPRLGGPGSPLPTVQRLSVTPAQAGSADRCSC